MPFTFADLFAGIGGFHAALAAMGGECVYAVEVDKAASKVYQQNWNFDPLGDITEHVSENKVKVPRHDVLVAGFPCQPFSKSGAQRGMEETRGTLYWNILQVIRRRKPAVVLLENVRNLAGPRHRHEWQVIVETLRAEGYLIADEPGVFSPHLLPPSMGGRPQVRERVFITAVRAPARGDYSVLATTPVVINRPVGGWEPTTWNLESDLPLDTDVDTDTYKLSDSEVHWINAWDDFVTGMRSIRHGRRLPGFPLWGDSWVLEKNLRIPPNTPNWKIDFLKKNAAFYTEHRTFINAWTKRWDFYSDAFPSSRRKLEWQAQDTERLWDTVMHLRPSGIRAKRPTYLPALVAITQTSIIGPQQRRLTVREAARLQGLPDWFEFGEQSNAVTYRQLGNGVNVGVVWHVLKRTVERYEELLKKTSPDLVSTILSAPLNPDDAMRKYLH